MKIYHIHDGFFIDDTRKRLCIRIWEYRTTQILTQLIFVTNQRSKIYLEQEMELNIKQQGDCIW